MPEPLQLDDATRLAYVARYPHLTTLGHRAIENPIAARDFARAACRLTVPVTVTPRQVWDMTAVAQGCR